VVLIHEQELPPGRRHPDSEVKRLLRLSAVHAGILPHRDILQYQRRIYTVAEHPGPWDALADAPRRRPTEEALVSTLRIAQALTHLHAGGFAFAAARGAEGEGLVVEEGGSNARVADLALSAPLPADAGERRAQIEEGVAFVGRLLFYLATGEELEESDVSLAPDRLRPIVSRAAEGGYGSMEALVADLSQLRPTSVRPLKPSHGQLTHPGRQRSRNEDAIVTFTFDKEQSDGSVPIGFYLVADGMGGHDAGDIASRTVNEIVTDWIISTSVLPNLRRATRSPEAEGVPTQLLTEAIEEANGVLSRRGRSEGSDLGSTVTAALIIGDVATIANVGDSRTYLLRDGRLQQVTRDHSLVARLVDTGVIGPAEVRDHPQRNEVYRCLGHEPDTTVDVFTRQLQSGDVLILCSDGLWEMVLDADIQRIVENAGSLQRACDELVEAANRAGGEDNIAVIVVELE
jgi:protein phosphatase